MYFTRNLHCAGVHKLQHYETAFFRQQADAMYVSIVEVYCS